MRNALFASALSASMLVACSTPGIKYDARIMPNNLDAAATRSVAVEPFSGPGGSWYTRQFETMLANTLFDGKPWFSLAAYSNPDPALRSGIYAGNIDIVDYSTWEDIRTVKKCVEWDGLFDCETRAEVEEICFHEEIRVSVDPRLIEIGTGDVLFSDRYYGDASRSFCEDLGLVSESKKRKRKRARRASRAFYADASHDLVLEALSDTLGPIRRDIAPRNAVVKAKFMTNPLDPVVKADVRFEQAIEMSRKDPATSCALWDSLSVTYPSSPAVIYNNGACAEASQQFNVAQERYAEAAQLSLAFSKDGQTVAKPIQKALANVSSQRFDLQILNELTGEIAADQDTVG